MASIENKIREMMNRKAEELAEAFPGMGNNKEAAPMAQGSSEKPEVQMMNVSGAAKPENPVNKLAAGVAAKEEKPMAQGSSEQASVESEDDQETQGKTQAAKMKKAAGLPGHGAGEATNFTTHADPASVVNQASNAGNVYKEEAEVEAEDEFISEEEFNALSDEEKANYELVEMEEVEEAKKKMKDEEMEDEEEMKDEEEMEEAYQAGDITKKVQGAQASARAAKGQYQAGDVSNLIVRSSSFSSCGT